MSMAMSGTQIKEARGRAGLTQQELAEKVGVSLRTVTNWETGNAVPRSKMPVIQDVLGPYLVSEDTRRAVMLRLGQLARQRREEMGLSRLLVAREIEVSPTTMQNLEYGKVMPTESVLNGVERVLDWNTGSMQRIIDRAGEINPSEIRMEDLEGAEQAKPWRRGIDAYTTEELLSEVSKRVRLSEARWKMYTSGVEIPEPSEFRERPDYGLAANDDMTGGDDPEN